MGSITCQHHFNHQQQQQQPAHFYLQQHHPTPTAPTPASVTPHYNFPTHHNVAPQNQFGFQQSTPAPQPQYFDLDKFNQQANKMKDQINFINQQEQKNLRNHVNSVHQEGNEPHFEFAINTNYSDLEKASEQFVSLGNMAAKQNMPKVIKITKTVAVKQPVPMPYPVPVIKYIKEQVPAEMPPQAHSQNQYHHQNQQQIYQPQSVATPTPYTMTTGKPFDFKPSPFYSNYTSYISKYPVAPSQSFNYINNNHNNHLHNHMSVTPTTPPQFHHAPSSPSPSPAVMSTANKIAESYIRQEFYSTPKPAAAAAEYDTRPFYVTTSDTEMIKYIPVPYYVDDQGNRHDISGDENMSNSNGNEAESYYKSAAEQNVNSGKFHSQIFSYHPSTTPTPTAESHFNHHHQHSYEQPQALQATPHTKYYYSQGDVASVPITASVDNTGSSSSHYADDEHETEDYGSDEHQHVQYKYVYER